ncbi:hypothetical protein P9139_06465 [Curtobacterium flaccumfaciens]|nr:hypothetical protein P9139_06465 [Curtobacterium flaccumfaciens]
MRRDVAGRDIDEATAFYADLHNAHRVALTPVGRAFSYRVRAVGDVSMTLRSSALTANRWGRIEPDGQYFLTWAQGGSAAIDAGTDQEQVLTPGVAAMYPTGRAFTLEAPAGVVLHAVDFDATFLEALDAERRRADPRLLCFDTQARPDALDVLQRRLAAAAPSCC